ncbi:iron ABC transporter permease [Nocardioides gansuensis]|uniref:Iron ABC transporter permease n=1 Tax=Nocardioides gansuensis TaxID=2138300 RepID=A0A2T8FF22_9ACTN|nr:iron ABC transporter permease [Nocardioides gansuensis]PVG84322.1 iron ABC transporter permease [Nocardioides gansuensis]
MTQVRLGSAPGLATGRIATSGRPRGTAAAASGVAAAVVLVLLASAASIFIGSRPVQPAALLDPTHPLHAVLAARIPRTLLALAVGAALGLAGACLQGLTRNPLADPGILGINAGASLAMVLGMSVLGISDLSSYIWFAFAGAAVAGILVHAIASMGPGGATPLSLAIAGAALAALAASWTSAMLLADRQTMETFRFWAVGTVGGRGFDVLLTGLPFLLAGAVLALAGARLLDALALGDDLARGLGRRTGFDRAALGLAVVLLAGTATALAGPLAFVGLLVPHAVRAVTGPHHGRLLPLAAVAGAVLVTLADTLGRVVLPPAEVQVGIMTVLVGVPAFLALIRRGRMGAL